jgi:hypothetical protein
MPKIINVKEKKIVKLIQDYKNGKFTQPEMEDKMRKLGIENPQVILCQWELI